MEHICIFGTSIAYGAWDFEEQGWVNRLRRYIESKKETECLLYNLSISGDTTEWLLERLEIDLEAAEPDIIIFETGTNDSIFIKKENKNRVGKEQFQRNLEKIAKLAKKYTEKIIFIGLTDINEREANPWNEELGEYYYDRYLKEYDKILEDFCRKNGIFYIKLFDLLDKNKDLYDGVHPNSGGHKKIFEKVIKSLGEFNIL